ncbi:uracil-DNA glycosylase [Pararhizobium arenae]|uniref:uracil-DNA glycosylase n=1 Tax=Pararhizobium arenae TaxID=1856850 RepID=UPI00094B373B|nr:uracil-DNA glycosylase [Pararhizobium arenae]
MISIDHMSPAELATLLHFHADAGVEWLLEDDPIDRFAEFAASRAARSVQRQQEAPALKESRVDAQPRISGENGQSGARREERPAPVSISAAAAIPHEQAVSEARFAAESARSLAELKTAMEAFSGCSLRKSARNTVFMDGSPESRIMVIGPMPNADDDRDGLPFSGKQGQMLERMLSAIGLDRTSTLLTNVIAWRPPGNRVPSPRESEICRPFIERQIALAEPKHLLILGNFAARFLFGGTDTIHHTRGEWRDLTIAGTTVQAMATLHPQDLISAPASKRLAWQDLLAFKSRLRG